MPCIYVLNICNCPSSICVPLVLNVLNVSMYANEPKGLKLINKLEGKKEMFYFTTINKQTNKHSLGYNETGTLPNWPQA